METRKILWILVLVLGVTLYSGQVSEAEPIGSAFTYQGHLYDTNQVADGLYDFRFEIYDSPVDGNQLTSPLDVNELDVINGYFTTEIDFGSGPDSPNAVWLQIGIRPGDQNDPNVYTTLSPRQKITPTPYAFYAMQSRGIFVDEEGNVGIGTTEPARELDVDGDIGASGDLYLPGILNLNDSANTTYIQNVNDGIKFWVDTLGTPISFDFQDKDSSYLTILNNGKVGIGITSPSHKLNVVGDANITGNLYAGSGVTVGASTTYADGSIDRSTAAAFSIGGTNATTVTIGRDGQEVAIPGKLRASALTTGERVVVENPRQNASNNSSPRLALKAYDSSDTLQTMGLQLRTSAPETRLSFISSTGSQRGYIDSSGNLQTSGDLDINGTGTSDFAGNVTVNGNATVGGTLDVTGTINADGAITGDGGAEISGMLYAVSSDPDGKSVSVAESQSVQTNAGASASGTWNLPECSTGIGAVFTFVVAAGQNLNINPDNADQILGLTDAAGDSIQSSTVGDTITLMIVDSSNVVVLGSYGTWTDAN